MERRGEEGSQGHDASLGVRSVSPLHVENERFWVHPSQRSGDVKSIDNIKEGQKR